VGADHGYPELPSSQAFRECTDVREDATTDDQGSKIEEMMKR